MTDHPRQMQEQIVVNHRGPCRKMMINQRSQKRFQKENQVEHQGRGNSFNYFTTKARHAGLYAATMTKKKRNVRHFKDCNSVATRSKRKKKLQNKLSKLEHQLNMLRMEEQIDTWCKEQAGSNVTILKPVSLKTRQQDQERKNRYRRQVEAERKEISAKNFARGNANPIVPLDTFTNVCIDSMNSNNNIDKIRKASKPIRNTRSRIVQNELYRAQNTSWEATQKYQEKSQKFYDNVVDAPNPRKITTRNPKTRQSYHGPCRKMMKKVVQLLTHQTKDHHLHRFKCEFDRVIEEANNDLLLPTKTVETRSSLIHIGHTLCAYGEQLIDFVPNIGGQSSISVNDSATDIYDDLNPKAWNVHSNCSDKQKHEHVHEFAATTFVDSKLNDAKALTNEELEFEQLLHQVDEFNNPVFWNDNMKPSNGYNLSNSILSSEADDNFSFSSNEFEDSSLSSDEEQVLQHCFISFDQTSEHSDDNDVQMHNEVTNDQQELPLLEQIVEGGRENDNENLSLSSNNLSSNLSAVSEAVIEDLDHVEQQFNNEILIEQRQQELESHQLEREMISFDPNDYPFRSNESYALIEMTWSQFQAYINEFMKSLEIRSRLYEASRNESTLSSGLSYAKLPPIEHYVEMCTFLLEITNRYKEIEFKWRRSLFQLELHIQLYADQLQRHKVEEDEQMPLIDPSNWQQIDISSIEKQVTNVNIASPSTITMKQSNSTDNDDDEDRNKMLQLKFNKSNKLNKRSVIFSQENNPTEMPTQIPTTSTKFTSNFNVNQNANGNSILQSRVNGNTSDSSSSSSSSESSTSTKSSKSYSKRAKSSKSSRSKKKINQSTRSVADKDDKKYRTLVKTLMREAKSYDLKASV